MSIQRRHTRRIFGKGMIDKYHLFVIYIIENKFHLHTDMKLTANRIAGILRKQGYKLTPQRHAVLKAMAQSHDHLTPSAIFDRARCECPAIGRVTVYRMINLLAELRLICEVHIEGNYRSYLMRRPTEHHHHLICNYCGRAVDFTCCDLSELEQRLARETEFEIEGHLLEFHGRCRHCQKPALQQSASL